MGVLPAGFILLVIITWIAEAEHRKALFLRNLLMLLELCEDGGLRILGHARQTLFDQLFVNGLLVADRSGDNAFLPAAGALGSNVQWTYKLMQIEEFINISI